jgi:site-specific DNA-methyltransferase (adenine-specific)
MGYPYRSSYEFILLAQKGKRSPPEDRGVRNFFSDIAEVEWIKNPDAYPTEKPVELYERLIQQSSSEGALVLDPFAGSGACGEAAFNLRRNFLGFDVEQKALDYFERRRQHWIYEDPTMAPPMTGGLFDLFGE